MLPGVVITGGVVSAGGPRPPGGGVVWPKVGSPQQTRVPPVWIAQLCVPPEETWLKVPVVGVAATWCSELSPQQASVPSVRSPQARSATNAPPPELPRLAAPAVTAAASPADLLPPHVPAPRGAPYT